MPPAPHHNLSESKIATVIVVDVSVSPFHRSAKTGPFRVEETQTFNSTILAAHFEDPNTVDGFAIRLSFIPGNHTYVVFMSGKPSSHQRILPLNSSDVTVVNIR
jgi:hypothetical protein